MKKNIQHFNVAQVKSVLARQGLESRFIDETILFISEQLQKKQMKKRMGHEKTSATNSGKIFTCILWYKNPGFMELAEKYNVAWGKQELVVTNESVLYSDNYSQYSRPVTC